MPHIIWMCADSTYDAGYGLHKQRAFYQAAIHEMREVVQMRGVVTFEFKACPVIGTRTDDELDILESIAKYHIARPLKKPRFPIVFEFLEAVQHRIQTKIH